MAAAAGYVEEEKERDGMTEGLTVIIADDDPVVRDLIADCVGELGLSVQKVSTGSQVLKLLQDGLPSLIILDVYMPGLNGLKVCSAIRATQRWSSVPVLIVSAYGDRQTLAKSIEAGANDFVVKPFTVTVLIDKIRRLVDASQEPASLAFPA